MFSFIKSLLKAKPPEPVWTIKVNNRGEYFVCRNETDTYLDMRAHLYFAEKKYGNVQQCEDAIAEWYKEQWYKNKTVVKTI